MTTFGPGSTARTTNTNGVVPAATIVASEYGDGDFHFTRLVLTDFAVGTSGDDAALALGAKIYTMPAGEIIINGATMVGTIAADISVTTAANAEVGIGTVVGSGVNATLGAVNAAAENVCGPVVIAAYADTAVVGLTIAGAAQPFLRLAATGGLSHDLYLNTAATWADVTAAGPVTFTGVVTLNWRKVN